MNNKIYHIFKDYEIICNNLFECEHYIIDKYHQNQIFRVLMEAELLPWTEKYRPNNIDNIVGKINQLNHLLFKKVLYLLN